MDRATRLAPLGFQRLRLLECLGGNSPHAPGYFAPPADVDIFRAFSQYANRLSQQWAGEGDPQTVSLLATARLLTGDASAAFVILDHLPMKATKLDHGAGICLIVPLLAMSVVLPIPGNLKDVSRWVAGSAEQSTLRAWLAGHRNELRWLEAAGEYQLAGAGIG